jgi:inhibitor of cysteine peptidase
MSSGGVRKMTGRHEMTAENVEQRPAGEPAARRRVLAVVAAALVGLALGAGGALAGRTVTVGASADGTSLRLEQGDTLVVRLAGNMSTGYRWEIASRPSALRRLGSSYETRKSTPPMAGQGGTFVFRFAARTGHGALRLVYHRPWEKQAPPLKTFTLRVGVR